MINLKKMLVLPSVLVLFGAYCLCFLSACGTTNRLLNASKNITNYDISCAYNDETKSLFASQTTDYINSTGTTLYQLNFNLYPNAFRTGATANVVSDLNFDKAYPNGFSEGKIEIKNVEVNDKSVNFTIGGVDENILIVPIVAGVKNSSSISIDFDFDLTIPNCLHRFGYNDNSVNLGNWYPVVCEYVDGAFVNDLYSSNGDPFYSSIANYAIEFTCNQDFTIANSGKVLNTTVENSQVNYTLSATAVRDFAIVLSKNFDTLTATVGDTLITYYYYDDENAEDSILASQRAVTIYNSTFGEYPYSTLAVVETGFVHGGMEYPNLVYISDAVENSSDYINVIVHEIAHQWWYGVVGDNQYAEGWIDEGLSEYSCIVFYEAYSEYNKTRNDVVGTALQSYLLFLDVYKDVFQSVDTTMTRKLNAYITEPEYTYMAYVKSVLMFDNLRQLIGDKKFFKGLASLFDDNYLSIASRDDVVNAFEKQSGTELSNFFSSWLDGKIVIESL